MASRTLLCVEPDEAAVDVIRGALEPYGFEVTSIPNGEAAIEWARQNEPELIVVSVEPRKVGYAVCNKLKRSAELSGIPLILTSGEETPQTFEQHKKLKSRADEYLLKPFGVDEIVTKVGSLLHLSTASGGANGAPTENMGASISEELSVGDSDIVEQAPPASRPSFRDDPMFDQEADAAFAAIQSTSESTAPIRTSSAQPRGDWDDERTRTVSSDDAFYTDAQVDPVEATANHLALFPSEEAIPPSPDEVSVTSHMPDAALEAKLVDLGSKVHTLEAERNGLYEQIEDLKRRLTSQPLSKEKEFLNLREVINRKEKDILDLRDALDARERQLLDNKDRVRENERSRRDLEEKMLDVEKNLMAAQERSAALAHDKEKSLEREKALKARLDGAMTEIQKAHDEADSFKRRLAQTEDRARGEQEKVRAELQARLDDMVERHQAEVARLSDERVQVEEDLKSEYEALISKLKSERAAELEAAHRRTSEEQKALEERFDNDRERMRREHEKALASAKEELGSQLSAERQAHAEAVEVKEQNHKIEIQSLRRRLEEDLAAAEERRQKELGEWEARRQADLDGAEQRRRTELQAREDEHLVKLAEMDRQHFNEKTELGERHRQELDQAHLRSARAEGELAARLEELTETQRRLATLESDRDALRTDLRDREVKLGQLRDRSAELEAKSAEYEDQILRAYQKLRSDEKVVDRAKRALAVALQLLDDRAGPAPAPSAAGPTAAPGGSPVGPSPPGGPLSGMVPARVGEEPSAGG
jgi:CheY-like chemotaxis protein